jgi:hypothetical protein
MVGEAYVTGEAGRTHLHPRGAGKNGAGKRGDVWYVKSVVSDI